MSMMLRMAGTLGQRRMSPLHPMTRDYIARLKAVDGHEPAFDSANDYLIRELVNLGGAYWDTMGTMTTLCGKLFAGLLVPLRDGMNVGTNVNFVAGDFNAKTGLVGDGSSKYIDSNRNNNADGQDDQAIGCWINTAHAGSVSGGPRYMGAGTTSSGATQFGRTTTGQFSRNNSSTSSVYSGTAAAVGYAGLNRNNSSDYQHRANGANQTNTVSSQTPFNANIAVFCDLAGTGPAAFSDGRLSLYHIGPALNLATLDGILTEYMARIDEVTL